MNNVKRVFLILIRKHTVVLFTQLYDMTQLPKSLHFKSLNSNPTKCAHFYSAQFFAKLKQSSNNTS